MSIFDELAAEFPRSAVSWRAQSVKKDGSSALALAYIDARDVMNRLDGVLGPANWKDRYEFNGTTAICYLSIRVDDEWVEKADGAGATDVEAEKGQLSDAFKRSAVKWQIGRYLYDVPAPWVPCKSYESEWNGKKKWVWSAWNGDPWDFVKGLKPAAETVHATKPKTVAELKAAYEKLKGELATEQVKGWRNLQGWLKDPSVLADIEALGRFADDFKKEARAIFDLAKSAEQQLGEPAKVTGNYVPPDFSDMQDDIPYADRDELQEALNMNGENK